MDLAKSVARACVLSPLCFLSSSMTFGRLKPFFMRSATSASVNLSLGRTVSLLSVDDGFDDDDDEEEGPAPADSFALFSIAALMSSSSESLADSSRARFSSSGLPVSLAQSGSSFSVKKCVVVPVVPISRLLFLRSIEHW